MGIKITACPNGPLIVEGEIELIGSDGKPIDRTGKPKTSLCRCGASASKPLCDGSHKRITFRDPDTPAATPA